MKNDLSDFEQSIMVRATQVSQRKSHTAINWDFLTDPSLKFSKNSSKKRTKMFLDLNFSLMCGDNGLNGSR